MVRLFPAVSPVIPAARQGHHPHLLAGWVWVMALPKRLLQVLLRRRHRSFKRRPQIRHNFRRFVLELPPGNAHRPPAFGDEDAVAQAVALELLVRAVNAAAVELHRNALALPEGVDLEEAA